MRFSFWKKSTKKRGNEESERSDQEDPASEEGPYAVAKALQIKRWEDREGPFRGFDSPLGKF